jgi:hypothetical protein
MPMPPIISMGVPSHCDNGKYMIPETVTASFGNKIEW